MNSGNPSDWEEHDEVLKNSAIHKIEKDKLEKEIEDKKYEDDSKT